MSFVLKKLKVYRIGPTVKRHITINHVFFVGGLKVTVFNLNFFKEQLDLVTQFSIGIRILFGKSKCAFPTIAKGKIVEIHEAIVMKWVTIKL